MLTGRQFRLHQDSLVIAVSDHSTVTIPAGQIVRVTSGPRSDDPRMVDIRWKERRFIMFAEDIKRRGGEVCARKSC
jgi:hypothetical protein